MVTPYTADSILIRSRSSPLHSFENASHVSFLYA